MRKELLGPVPLALGLLLVSLAVLFPPRVPPTGCDACPLLSPAEFDAEDAAGYPHIAKGTTVFLDGQVADVRPSALLESPYRLVGFAGSPTVFNVTNFNPLTAPVGSWTRISAVHNGESERTGPENGHRWRHVGPTTSPGGQVVSLAALAAGVSVAAWGAATWRAFGNSREEERSLRARLAAARAGVAADPAARSLEGLAEEMRSSRSMIRRGQFDGAGKALDSVEAALKLVDDARQRIETARAAAEKAGERALNVATLLAVLNEAEAARRAGDGSSSKALLSWAESALLAAPRAREYIELAASSIEANRALAVDDEEAAALLARARQRFDEGLFVQAFEEATASLDRSRDTSPAAARAARETEELEDYLRTHPAADYGHQVRERLRDAREAYHVGQFDRALAEARVGRWVADPLSLSQDRFRAIVEQAFRSEGFEVLEAEEAPAGGFIAARGAERVLVVTAAWREFPGERVLFAIKDYLNSGSAVRAVLHASSYFQGVPDERIETRDTKRAVEMLRNAALVEILSGS